MRRPPEELPHGLVEVILELADPLREGGDPDRLAPPDRARARLHDSRDEAEQGGLARPVDAEDAGPLAGRDPPLDVAQHLVAVVVDRGVEQVNDVLAEPGDGEGLQRYLVPDLGHVGDERVGRVDVELGLGRAGRGAAAQPGEFLAREVLPFRLGGGGHPVALHPLQDVRGVAALERLHDPVVDLPGGGAHLVEEPAIVGDDDQPAGGGRPAPLEMAREPGDRLDVQVVGRLVEQQDVPLPGEQPGQLDPAPLAAAERADRRVPGDVGQQAADHVPRAGVACPHVLGRVADDRAFDRERVVEGVGLAEHAHRDPAADGDPPGVGLQPSRRAWRADWTCRPRSCPRSRPGRPRSAPASRNRRRPSSGTQDEGPRPQEDAPYRLQG